MNVHFSSKTDDWATPQDLFDKLNNHFNFTLDVCASDDNAKCGEYFTVADDGLKQDWTSTSGAVWMNPPYGRGIGEWMRKAYEAGQQGKTVVCLVPARTCTSWWHDYAAKGDVLFLRGRLKFGNAKNSAPFPSAIVVFGRDWKSIFKEGKDEQRQKSRSQMRAMQDFIHGTSSRPKKRLG